MEPSDIFEGHVMMERFTNEVESREERRGSMARASDEDEFSVLGRGIN